MESLNTLEKLKEEAGKGNIWHVVLVDYIGKSFTYIESFDSEEKAVKMLDFFNDNFSLPPGSIYDIVKTDENGSIEKQD